jgi:hypothetical protein
MSAEDKVSEDEDGNDEDDIWAALGALSNGIALVRVTRNSLDQRDTAGDEVAALDMAIDVLVDVHQRIDLLQGRQGKPTGEDDGEPYVGSRVVGPVGRCATGHVRGRRCDGVCYR